MADPISAAISAVVTYVTSASAAVILNVIVAVARAEAGILSTAEAISQSYSFAGALGGLTMALIHLVGIAFADEKTDRRKVSKAVAEGVCAVIVGAIVAHYFTPYVGRWVPRVDPADLLGLAYAIGVVAWRAMPLIIEQLPRFVSGLNSAILAGIRNAVNGNPPPPPPPPPVAPGEVE